MTQKKSEVKIVVNIPNYTHLIRDEWIEREKNCSVLILKQAGLEFIEANRYQVETQNKKA
jgi:hypothetical protein